MLFYRPLAGLSERCCDPTLFSFWEPRQVDIKLAVSPPERLAIYRFRYAVIVEEMGVQVPSADHSKKLIQDTEDDSGHLFAASIDGRIVGTARINFIRDGTVSPHSELLQLSRMTSIGNLSVCTRFLIAKDHRGTLLAIRVMQAIYRFMRQSELEFDFILVKHDLVELYTRIGYLPYGTPLTHPEIGEVVPLRLSISDEHHLRAIRSPLVPCLKDFSHDRPPDGFHGKPARRSVEETESAL